MLWLVIVLQTMAPFIHAHAGVAQPGGYAGHGGFLHWHQKAYAEVLYDVMAADERGAEIAVAQGMRLRHAMPDTLAAPPATAWQLLPAAAAARLRADLPPLRPLCLAPPPHTFPHALAPPFV